VRVSPAGVIDAVRALAAGSRRCAAGGVDPARGGSYTLCDSVRPQRDLVPMRVAAVLVDAANAPSALLEAVDGGAWLSLAIGVAEAPAIAAELDGVRLERPQAHDLIASLLGCMDAAVDRIEIEGGTCPYATIHIAVEPAAGGIDRALALDARPSDALAIALRTGAPIYVARGMVAVDGCAVPALDQEVGKWKA